MKAACTGEVHQHHKLTFYKNLVTHELLLCRTVVFFKLISELDVFDSLIQRGVCVEIVP